MADEGVSVAEDAAGEERLEDVARECAGTNQINIGGNTVTKSTEHLPEKQKTLIRWAFQVARDKQMSWAELERMSGVSQSTWYRVWHDKYINPKTQERVELDGVCKKVEKWKALFEARAHMTDDLFVETSVWSRIDWICQKVRVRRKLGFIYGESHCGKSECLKRVQRLNNHGATTYVEMPPSAGVQLMTRTIAKALHVSSGTCYEKLIDDVIAALDDSKLLLVDEIHRVFTTYQRGSVMRCLDVLRYIHDQTKCGMVLCGTNVFRDELAEGAFWQYLKQLRRRGLYEIQIPDMPPRSDLDLIAKHYGLSPAEGTAEETMLHIVKNNGLAVYFTRLDDAVEMATKASTKVTWHHFEKAVAYVEKMRSMPGAR
jgi:DNA transposition AAA+ family ATPase